MGVHIRAVSLRRMDVQGGRIMMMRGMHLWMLAAGLGR
jgi:hypothetical protein